MVEIFKHPLFVALVGLTFSVGFAPWLTRRWQDHQRDREIRANLVADMSRCIMSLVAVLERHHPGNARKEAMANPSLTGTRGSRRNRKSVATFDETAKSVATFDVDRCVIGTKLETYFLSAGDKGSLASRWTTFADELILFSATSPTSDDGARAECGRRELAKRLNQKTPDADNAAKIRSSWVDESWGKTEQLFLNEKRALLEAVRKEPMVPSAPPPTALALWLFWSFIAFIAACVALVGADLAGEKQPTARTAFRLAAAATAVLAVILAVIRLFSWIRIRRIRRSVPS